jgi:hypothetical protein
VLAVPDGVLACGLALVVPTPEPHADNPVANANISGRYHLSFTMGVHSRAVLTDSLPIQNTFPLKSNATMIISVALAAQFCVDDNQRHPGE